MRRVVVSIDLILGEQLMVLKLRAVVVLAMLIGMATIGSAQSITPRSTTDYRTWMGYNGDHRIKDTRFSVLLEAQLRVFELDNRSGQYIVRTGLLYDVNKWLRVSAGYAYQHSYPGLNQTAFPEHRVWQGVQTKNKIGHVQLLQRVRLEQRWIGTGIPGIDYQYHNRVRYAVRATIPLSHEADYKYYVKLQNEVFFNFGKGTRNVYDQNRGGVVFGYRVGAIGDIETGYLLQALNSPSGVISYHHILSINLVSTLPFGKH